MKKVLMLNTYVGSMNTGDEIIMRSIKKNFKEIYDNNYMFELASHTPLFNMIQQGIYKKRFELYYNADYKFLCGTNALYTNMLRPMPSWNISIFNNKLIRGTICLGVGAGYNSKNVTLYTKLLYNMVLNKEYYHSVRDERTKEILEEMGYKVLNTGCPTLWGMTKEHCSHIPTKKADSVVFTLTSLQNDDRNDKLLIKILKDNYKKVYFWPQTYDDLNYLNRLNELEGVHIVSPNLTGYEHFLNTNDVDYVGTRLHGGIFSMQHFKRSIIIGIDYRALNMKETYNLPYIDRGKIEMELEELINKTWETDISGLDFISIDKWKKQFLSDNK